MIHYARAMPHVAFVGGATGLTGRHLALALASQGIETWAHVREDSPRLAEWAARFEKMGAKVDKTAWRLEAFEARFQALQPTMVFGCLGTTKARETSARRRGEDAARETYEAVDIALTKILIEAGERCGSSPHFVYLSSVGAGRLGQGAYLDARTVCEEALAKSTLAYSIARPSFIVGDRDESRAAERFVPMLDGLARVIGVFSKKSGARYSSIDGGALARVLMKLGLEGTKDTRRIVEREDFAL